MSRHTVKIMTKGKRRKEKAFTLLELSIVIVIIGLLIAATMAGQELLNIAKMKSVISEFEEYKIAADNFKTQYNALPGDIKNASSLLSGAANGNGNGLIGTSGSDLDYTEPYYLWNHLTLAKLVPGTFSGSSATGATVGTNVPASKYIDLLGYGIVYRASIWSYVDRLNRPFVGNYIIAGRSHATKNHLATDAFLAADALYIDTKMDDGTPNFGRVLGGAASGGTCTSGSAYDPTQNAVGCTIAVNID